MLEIFWPHSSLTITGSCQSGFPQEIFNMRMGWDQLCIAWSLNWLCVISCKIAWPRLPRWPGCVAFFDDNPCSCIQVRIITRPLTPPQPPRRITCLAYVLTGVLMNEKESPIKGDSQYKLSWFGLTFSLPHMHRLSPAVYSSRDHLNSTRKAT